MELRAASATDRGKVREKNEDSVLADIPLVAVADGMGGHKAGEVASSMALETLATWKERLKESSGKQTGELLRQAIDEANQHVWEKGQQEEDLAGMGTTITAGWIGDSTIALAQVGDSRAYLLRGGTLQQLTTDQNVAQDLVRRGRISADEAASSPHRHVILQAVGADPQPLDIEITSVELHPGDRVILATDGLFGMVRSAERIRDILVEHTDPDAACRALIDEANAEGGEDNISVLVLDAIGEEGETAAVSPDVRIERETSEPDAVRPVRSSSRRPVIVAIVVTLVIAAAAFFATRIGGDTLLVAERGGTVVVMRGRPGTSGERATGDVVRVLGAERLDRFARPAREDLREGIPVDSMAQARQVVENLPRLRGPRDTPTPVPSPPPTPSSSPGGQAT